MKTILVDDEMWMLRQFETECRELEDIQLEGVFDSPIEALEYARNHAIELAFLDIEMPHMNGLELAGELRSMYPDMIIIFVSGYDKYMVDAYKMNADYFVMKPYTKKNIEDVVSRAKLLSKRIKKRFFIKTFGNFDVFVDGKPIKFSSARAKELLAYLVDRNGNVVETEEGFSLLWEDRFFDASSASSYRKVLSRLQSSLVEAGALDILFILSHGRAINKSAVDCDYFSYLDGDKQTISQWNGEYMSNYSWGEYTLANLLANRESLNRRI